MTKNPSWKLPKVFVLIIPEAIRIHFSEREVAGLTRGVPVSLMIPQVILIQFGKWEEVVCGPRRGVKIIKDIDKLSLLDLVPTCSA